MNTIWNIFKKDLYRCRWLLLAMVGVLFIKAALMDKLFTAYLFRSSSFNFTTLPKITLNGATLSNLIMSQWREVIIFSGDNVIYFLIYFASNLDVILIALIVLRLLSEDSALNELAFWRCRPIGRGQMLAAKALGIGVAGFLLQLGLQAIVSNRIFQETDLSNRFWTSNNVVNWKPNMTILWWHGMLAVFLMQACWIAPCIVVCTLWRSRIVGIGALMLATISFFLLVLPKTQQHIIPHLEDIILCLYLAGLGGSALIGSIMYLKSERLWGFCAFGATYAIISSIIIFS